MDLFPIVPIAYAESNANPCENLGSFSALCSFTSNDFGFVLSTAITIILVIAIILSVVFFMYGGIRWILSRGDKEKMESARNQVIAAIIGLVMVFLVFFIVNLIFGIFFPGKSLKDLKLPSLVPDTKAPMVEIVSPISDSTISGIVPVRINATDDRGVEKVEFYVDKVLKSTNKREPFEYNWNTTVYKHNSVHTVSVKAYDSADNVGAAEAVVAIFDTTKPNVKITSPANGGKVKSNSANIVSAQISDISSISSVEFRVNGILRYIDYEAPYSYDWKVPATKGVTYRIEVKATDIAENQGISTNSAVSF